MKYLAFEIKNYRAIEESVIIDLRKNELIPIVGINECGKTTILQAIYSFDHLNDSEYEGKHIKNVINLYKTKDIQATVTAIIEISSAKLTEFYSACISEHNEKQTKLAEEEADELKKKELEKKIFKTEFPLNKNKFNNIISIERNLVTKKYSVQIESITFNNATLNETFAQYVVDRMPYILYNDDFIDRPPNFIEVPRKKPEEFSGWLAIFERLFEVTDTNTKSE